MTEATTQSSFNSGEWSPNLFARVDIQKYRSGAALLENFFVDYRGGASTRPGTKYVIQAYKSATQVRLISFQSSFSIGYMLEFGNGYVRFIYQGAPVVETAIAITAATQANPCVLTIPGNNYNIGDWIYVVGVGGMTQLNGRYFSVIGVAGNLITLGDLNGANINSTGYGAYTAGGTAARIYTITSPYTSADDLRLIKFAQNANQMVLCHPNHTPYVLTLTSATNWTLVPISIGASIAAPTGVAVATTLGVGTWNYSYGVTAIDANGQESSMSTPATLATQNIRAVAGTNQISWTASAGAVAYNVYEATISAFGAVPALVSYGFIGTCNGVTFDDSNIAPDFTETPPISKNPFVGYGVDHVNVTVPGVYTTVPGVSFSGSSTTPATAIAQLQVQGTPAITAGGTGYAVNDLVNFGNSLIMKVTAVNPSGGNAITAWVVYNPGAITVGSTPANPIAQVSTTGSGIGATATATWGVGAVIVTNSGAGYSVAPTVVFSAGAAVATAVLGSATISYPTVPGYIQQRLFLGGIVQAPATFYMSKPGQYFNFDTSRPVTAVDSISGTLASGTLNTIKSVIGATAGMIILTDKAAWLVNGGSPGSAITPLSIVANPQSYIGANDVPPIVANYDILFVQSKGSAIRNLTYNFYFNVFTGTDISITSSHLFYGYLIQEWTWAEQPYYLVQAIRNDGYILSLTFLKEQEFIAWSHYTTNGLFKSISSVIEPSISGNNSIDAIYTVVQRTVNGNVVQYIERFAERSFPGGLVDAWCVDAGLQYVGVPATTFIGAEHLAGLIVTGLADGNIITPFTMPVNGIFTLPVAASKVTIGLAFTCKLQTLPLELGEPTVQGKVKKITCVDIKVKDTLGLSIGSSFSTLVPMKDLVIGNVSSALTGQPTQVISGLVSGDARTFLDPTYTVPGQYCIQQSNPYPATVLGAFPQFVTEDRR